MRENDSLEDLPTIPGSKDTLTVVVVKVKFSCFGTSSTPCGTGGAAGVGN